MNNKVDRIYELAKCVYNYHLAGGHFHLVLDDGNIANSHILYCLESALNEESDIDLKEVYMELGILLLLIPYKERLKITNNYNKYANC